MKRLVLIVVVGMLALPAGAGARPFASYEDGLFRLGVAHWGMPICQVIERSVEPWETMTHTAGIAYPCKIVISDRYVTEGDSLGCIIVLHEVGHLDGLSHSPDPASIMYTAPSLAALPSAPECLDPLASIAALPPAGAPTWPQKMKRLEREKALWQRRHDRCENMYVGKRWARCWSRARRLRSRLAQEWAEATAQSFREPIYR